MQRNTIIALGNSLDRTALLDLLRCIEEDIRPLIRGTVAWSISKIVTKRDLMVIEFLQEAVYEIAQAIEVIKNKKIK